MKAWIRIAKDLADMVANIVKWFEERDSSAIILHDVRRSLQLDRYSCGVQSVKVIVGHFGKSIPIDTIERRLATDKDGTALTAIRRLFNSHGLTTSITVDAELRDIKRAIDSGYPALVSLSGSEHWAVVYGYSRGAIFLADSSITKNVWCRVSEARFLKQWDRWMMSVRLN